MRNFFTRFFSARTRARQQQKSTTKRGSRRALPNLEWLEARLAPAVGTASLTGWDALSAHLDGSGRREVVVLDPRVPDASLLLAGLQPGTQVVLLSASSDGLTQIADALAGPAQTTDIHILGHGAAGEMLLGDDLLNAATVANDTQALDRLAAELGPDSDLLLYGCQTGAGTTGAALVESLARATGASVAASSSSVGAAALDGGWDLNVASGRIDAASPWPVASLADYPDRLGLTITTTTLPSGKTNQTYSQTIAVTGGTAPVSFSVTAGSLPPGLTLNSSTTGDHRHSHDTDSHYPGRDQRNQRLQSQRRLDRGQQRRFLRHN